MKIVKFGNGMYAVRRGNWLTGYEYLDNAIAPGWEKHWWPSNCLREAYVDTLAQAQNLCSRYEERKGQKFDFGKPVSISKGLV